MFYLYLDVIDDIHDNNDKKGYNTARNINKNLNLDYIENSEFNCIEDINNNSSETDGDNEGEDNDNKTKQPTNVDEDTEKTSKQ